MTSQAQIKQLVHLLSRQRNEALFSCGGAIPINPTAGPKPGHCPPVTIRFSPSSFPSANSTLVLPSSDVSALVELLRKCSPATFGHEGRDVYDESYREASKMDPDRFCTDFSPHDAGIVDVVGQLLHPSLHTDVKFGFRGVRAELYKLNVYSGPSGMFKAHVDTPRGPEHFGTLVVCLPCAHTGGQFLVGSGATTITYDWSAASATTLQWAAFYADCKHEVQPVISGHRITLTYNLYDTKGTGVLYSADFRPSPLAGFMKTLVDNPDFLPQGGTLGIYSTHSYAHSRAETINCLPRILKGLDMAVYQIFTYLGFKVHLRPIYSGRQSRVLNKRARLFPGGGNPVAVGKELKPMQTRKGAEHIEEWDSHKYGNEAEVGTEYSSLALLIPIPPFSYLTNTRMPASLWRDRSSSPTMDKDFCEDESQMSDELSDEELKWYEDEDELATFTGRHYTPPEPGPSGPSRPTLVTMLTTDRSRSMPEGGSTWMPAVVASAVAGGEQRGMFVDLTEAETEDDTEVDMDNVGHVKQGGGMEDESQSGWSMESLGQVE